MFTKQSLVGLDIGSQEIKAVEMVESAGQMHLSALGTAPAVDREDLPQALKELFSRAGIRTKNVAVSVSGKSVVVRYISMPRMSEEELRSSLKYEAEKHIPFELEEVALDCAMLDPGSAEADQPGDEMQILLVAARKETLDDLLGVVRAAGLLPVAVDVDGFALGSAFELTVSPSGDGKALDGVTALIDVGGSKTSINILEDGVSSFSREIYLAGKDFTESISRRMGVSPEEGDRIKRESGSDNFEVMECVSPILGDLAGEIYASIDYFENHHERVVGSVRLSGGSALLPGIGDAFEQTFGREVSEWNPLEGVEEAEGSAGALASAGNSPQLAVAVGLASRVLDY